ncbi:T6SS immunity protein Tli4 family protein [Pseudomonas sp. NPDC090233]|uniref:T6SS immunity protein Tli4 family protein n=1 Tax=Pseudomonas sp. NPDC090233 TaxID=3364479 RepID=UPI00383A2E79
MLKFKYLQAAARMLAIFCAVATIFSPGVVYGAPGMHIPSTQFYFGRYMFSAPTNGVGSWTSYKVVQKDLEFISKNGAHDIKSKVQESILEIEKLHKSGYEAFDQTLPLEGGGIIVVSKASTYNFEIYYLTSHNTLYRQQVESISLDAFNKAVKVAQDINSFLHYRHPAESPPSGTFAVEAGYLTLPLDKYPEQVSIGLPISTIPGIHLTFDTQRIGKPEPGLIERYEQRTSGIITPTLQMILTNSTVMRKTKRQIAGLSFDELLLKTRADGRTFYTFRVEFPGIPKSSTEPYTVLEMSTLEKGESFNSDSDAIEFWENLVNSIKRI